MSRSFFLFLEQGIGPGEYFQQHLQQFSQGRQMPLPRVAASAWVSGLNLNPTLGQMRVVFALAGCLLIPVLWLVGLYAWNARLGILLAYLGALNPFSIYWSRTAHVYAFPLLFCTLALVPALYLMRVLRESRPVSWHPFALLNLATTAACYSHMSAWPFSALLWLLSGALLWKASRKPLRTQNWWAFGLGFGLWVLLLLPWILLFLQGALTQTADPVWSTRTNPNYSLAAMWRMPFVMTLGGGWRGLLTVGLLSIGAIAGMVRRETRFLTGLLLVGGVVSFLLLTTVLSTGFFALRYYTPLWCLLLLLVGLGAANTLDFLDTLLLRLSSAHKEGHHSRTLAPALVLSLILGACLYSPVNCLVKLRGNPLPMSQVSTWLDENLPPGTPVVVDGMWLVLQEFQPHLPERVQLTFTVPDVGLEQWKENNWRQSVQAFLERFPEAALIQSNDLYSHLPEVGRWNWPEEHFARVQTIRNEPGITLRDMLLGPIEDFYPQSQERDGTALVVKAYSNQPEDLLKRAQKKERPSLVSFGTEWRYAKGRDGTDWRTLEHRASLTVWNPGQQPKPVSLLLKGRATGGKRALSLTLVHGHSRQELGERIFEKTAQDWALPVLELPPGRSEVVFEVQNWPEIPGIFLLSEFQVEPMEVAPSEGAPDGARESDSEKPAP